MASPLHQGIRQQQPGGVLKLTTAVAVTTIVFIMTYPSIVSARAMLANSTAANAAAPGSTTPPAASVAQAAMTASQLKREKEILRHKPVKIGAKAQKLALAAAAARRARAPPRVEGVFYEPDEYLASLVVVPNNGTGRHLSAIATTGQAVQIRPVHTNFEKCMDVPYADMTIGHVLWNWYCNGEQAQEFWIWYKGYDGVKNRNLYYITTQAGRCLDVLRPRAVTYQGYRGQTLIQWDCLYNDNQIYAIELAAGWSKGVYEIKPTMYGGGRYCLGVRGGDKTAGAEFINWDCNGNGDQKFWIKPVFF